MEKYVQSTLGLSWKIGKNMLFLDWEDIDRDGANAPSKNLKFLFSERGKQVQFGGIPTFILPAESSKSSVVGTLASNIVSHLSSKPHHDLNTYKAKQLEFTSNENIYPKKSNIAISCLYKR